MKIIIIVGRLYIGGIERYSLDLIEGYIEKGYSVELIVLYKVLNHDKLRLLNTFGVKVYDLQLRNGRDIRLPIRLKQIFLRAKPNIVHLNNLPLFGVLALVGRRFKTIYTIHQMTYNRLLYKAYERHIDGVIALSTTIYNEFFSRYKIFKFSKWKVINNGVKPQEFHGRSHSPEEPIKLIMVTRLAQDKHPEQAVEILKYLKQHSSLAYELHFYGKGDTGDLHFLQNLEATIKSLELDKLIHFHGWLEEVQTSFECSHGLLMLSDKECFPYAVIESLSFGVPVFSFDIEGGLSDIHKDKVSGIVVSNRSCAKLAIEIDEIFNAKGAWEKLALSTYQEAKRFSLENMVKDTSNFYMELS